MVRGGRRTDLFGEEGHDGEDDERHEDAVRPELQLVPIHSPEGEKKNTFQLVWNEELTCYPIGWPKCQRWYVSLEGRLIILRCNEKETWSMQRAAGQQGDKVTSPSAICLILYLLRYRSGCGGGEEASAVWWSYKDLTASAWSEAARSNFKGSHSPAEASRINERELWQKNPLKPPEGFPLRPQSLHLGHVRIKVLDNCVLSKLLITLLSSVLELSTEHYLMI